MTGNENALKFLFSAGMLLLLFPLVGAVSSGLSLFSDAGSVSDLNAWVPDVNSVPDLNGAVDLNSVASAGTDLNGFVLFYSSVLDRNVYVNLVRPSDSDILSMIGDVNYSVRWLDSGEYVVLWDVNGVVNGFASPNAIVRPGDAVELNGSTPGCEAWYSKMESYNLANNDSSLLNYQKALVWRDASGAWMMAFNRVNYSDVCYYENSDYALGYSMNASCPLRQQWHSFPASCGGKQAWECDGRDGWAPQERMCRNIADKLLENWRCQYNYDVDPSRNNSCKLAGRTCEGDTVQVCAFKCQNASCIDACAGVFCGNYCSGDTRYYNSSCQASSGQCLPYNSENCSARDGYACNGNVKEYRDYFCGIGSCQYQTVSATNCDSLDTEGGWEYYCSGNERRRHQVFFDYACGLNDCQQVSAQYTNDESVETCSVACVGATPNAQCSDGCSGIVNVVVENVQGTRLANALVSVNGENAGATGSDGSLSIPTTSLSCGQAFSVHVVSGKGTDCGTKSTVINQNSDRDFVYFVCRDPLSSMVLGAVPGSFSYVLGESIEFAVTLFDEFSSMLSGARVGVSDPQRNVSLESDVNGFPWNYSSLASIPVPSEFRFNAFKEGFSPAWKTVPLNVEEKPSIKVRAENYSGSPLARVSVLLDGN
ncbi:MAG: hypothetical protein HY917_02780, partial [Candidatus Diapherotrites archaeon]|nr:hypothetical protein [Candidatus Diapherotrites archaeon]